MIEKLKWLEGKECYEHTGLFVHLCNVYFREWDDSGGPLGVLETPKEEYGLVIVWDFNNSIASLEWVKDMLIAELKGDDVEFIKVEREDEVYFFCFE
jgi:hypothetical protein